MGIFAGSGVGKSVMLGMMARYTSADVNVIGLIGERGREVNEFLERDLGPSRSGESVVVVATSDEPALIRVQAAHDRHGDRRIFPRSRQERAAADGLGDAVRHGAARDRPGRRRAADDARLSAVRVCPAAAAGRAGRPVAAGSITGFYSVLVEGDDPNEPVADTVRGLLDGHIVLSRKLASQAITRDRRAGEHQPVDERHHAARAAGRGADVRELLAAYRDHEDLISIGAYRKGANRTVDAAIEMRDEINRFLRQGIEEHQR